MIGFSGFGGELTVMVNWMYNTVENIEIVLCTLRCDHIVYGIGVFVSLVTLVITLFGRFYMG